MNERMMDNTRRRQVDVMPDLEGMVRRVGEHVNRILRENIL